eukprot:5203368-Pleurochrysis_carterae.AAC.2
MVAKAGVTRLHAGFSPLKALRVQERRALVRKQSISAFVEGQLRAQPLGTGCHGRGATTPQSTAHAARCGAGLPTRQPRWGALHFVRDRYLVVLRGGVDLALLRGDHGVARQDRTYSRASETNDTDDETKVGFGFKAISLLVLSHFFKTKHHVGSGGVRRQSPITPPVVSIPSVRGITSSRSRSW